MSDRAPFMAELEVLLAVMTDGVLSAVQRARLSELLRDHPEARRFYKRYIELHVMLEWEAGVAAEQADHAEQAEQAEQADHVGEADVLLELLRAEREAEVVLVQPQLQLQSAVIEKAEHPSLREIGLVAGYVITRPVVWGPIAAAVALAFVLTIVFSSTGPSPAPIAIEPDEAPATTTTTTTATNQVATLTNTSNAHWAEGALALGTSLHAGQRLALTQGFAQITTHDGAVAILEAPCTIELLDHDNALRLHAGKLVGICETESSKGFLVRTPHMDVTDLGTRFGVYVDEEGQSLAEVFEGVIQAKPGNQSLFEPINLSAGEVIAVNRVGKAIDRNRFAPDVFARLLEPYDGVTTLSGDIQWSSSALFIDIERPKWFAQDQGQIFQELPSVVVKSDLPLTTGVPWLDQRSATSQSNPSVRAGTTIRSYVVILNWGPDAQLPDRVVNGEIHFEGQVLGVIASTEHNRKFAEAIGSAGPRVWKGAWAFRPPLAVHGDQVILHEGGHAVSFRLDTTGRPPQDTTTFRAFRVLVQVDKKRGGINAD